MKQLATAILVVMSLVAAGCGDDDNDEPAGTTAAESTQAEPSTVTAPETTVTTPAEPSGDDEEAVKEAVIKWTFEGDCDYMTDKFLEDQLLGLGDNRKEKCDLFEKQHTKPQYSEDDLKIEDVQVTGTKATLIVTSDMAPDIKSKYSLVKNGDQWQIDSADLQ